MGKRKKALVNTTYESLKMLYGNKSMRSKNGLRWRMRFLLMGKFF
jgi:hypothetical protein